MTKFLPFEALRYAQDQDLTAVVSPPYDVLSPEDRARFAGKSKHNVVIIDCPLESDGDDRYTVAANTMRAWESSGVLVRDAQPSFTIYRMNFIDAQGRRRQTVGVLGAMEVCDEGADSVLPHERTTPKAKSDRLDLTRATRANLSPVWGLSLSSGLSELLAEPGTEVGRVVDEQGVEHIVERIDDSSRISAIEYLMATAPTVIADGHHRYAISRVFRDEERQGKKSPAAEFTLTYVAELNEEQLNVAAIHRLYNGIEPDDLLASLIPHFETTDVVNIDDSILSSMEQSGSMCFVRSDGTGVLLRPKPSAFSNVRNLDGAKLEHALADVSHEVSYQHGVQEVLHELRAGRARAAVLINPVTVSEIRRTADEHLLMPPKSTFFTPKLLTGLVFRRFD